MTDASNEAMLARRAAAVPAGLAQAMPIFVGRAVNGELWDIAGKRYIDFAGGIGTLNTGHCHPAITAAASRQLAAFTHVAAQVAGYPAYIELAERLNALAPVEGPAKTILLTTGAEAVENAVKIARAASGRPAVIAFDGAFHGRTFFTLGLTGKVVPYKAGFGPLPPHIHHIPFPDEARGLDAAQSLAAIDRLFYAETPPDQVAAIIIEPVQGEGGFNVAPRDLIAGLRALCDRHGILLIADEVQSGFGRTGRMFALDHY
ncbi:MAG: aspartate aminotransferase family protein, partial [Sphingomonas sp.]